MRTQRWRWFLVLVLVMSMVAAACGDDDDDTEAGGGDTTETTSGDAGGGQAEGTPIKVGAICSCSGPFGRTIDSAGKVVQAWAKAVNEDGGIEGHPVELTLKDDGGVVGNSVTQAKELIADGVAVIIDMTPLGAAWAKDASAAKIPVVGGNFSGIPYFQNPLFYPSGQTNDSIVRADILTAKAAGAKTLAQLFCAEAPQCQESVEPHKQAGEDEGVPVVYNASIAATAPNYTAQCVAAQQAGAEALFIGHSASVFARVAQDCERQGYKPIYIEQGTGFTMELTKTPGTMDRLWAPFPIVPFFAEDEEPVMAMNEVIDEYYPGLREQDTWSTYASQAWTGALLVEKGVELSGVAEDAEVTAADMIKGLDSVKDETLGGWSPPLTFTAGQPHSVRCWYTARVQNGEPRLVNNGELTCDEG